MCFIKNAGNELKTKTPKLFVKLGVRKTFELTTTSPLGLELLRQHGLQGRLMGPLRLTENHKLLGYLESIANDNS